MSATDRGYTQQEVTLTLAQLAALLVHALDEPNEVRIIQTQSRYRHTYADLRGPRAETFGRVHVARNGSLTEVLLADEVGR